MQPQPQTGKKSNPVMLAFKFKGSPLATHFKADNICIDSQHIILVNEDGEVMMMIAHSMGEVIHLTISNAKIACENIKMGSIKDLHDILGDFMSRGQ